MNAAIIAAIVALIGVGATLVTSIRNLNQQRDALKKTLAEQQVQTLNERFATAADKLGSDKSAIRIAGVYAMAVLADDWEKNRQTCIAVLCAYLRMPYEPYPGALAPTEKQREFHGSREVRWTLMRVITEHLRDPQAGSDRKAAGVAKQVAPKSWQGENYFDFSGAVFDGGTFSDARFSGATKVDFGRAEFSCSKSGKVSFHHAKFSGSAVSFRRARFPGGAVEFHDAEFSGGAVEFRDAEFSGGVVSFDGAEFSGGVVSFDGAEFSGGVVSFDGAEFSGGAVTFRGARFSGGTVDFSHAADWSDHRPRFDWGEGAPPAGVKLPAAASRASQ
jgi:hypothetical protein